MGGIWDQHVVTGSNVQCVMAQVTAGWMTVLMEGNQGWCVFVQVCMQAAVVL